MNSGLKAYTFYFFDGSSETVEGKSASSAFDETGKSVGSLSWWDWDTKIS